MGALCIVWELRRDGFGGEGGSLSIILGTYRGLVGGGVCGSLCVTRGMHAGEQMQTGLGLGCS